MVIYLAMMYLNLHIWVHVGINGSIEIYDLLKPKRMILTHFKHDMSYKDMVNYVKEYGSIDIAYDGMELQLQE